MSTESVFMCHSSMDAEFANNLANSLTKAGANVWIESINGQNDEDVTAEAIKSAKLFLIITSNNALEDESLKQEKDFARENKIERLLIKIEACDTESKMRWQKLPCIDFYINQEEGLQAILNKLNISNESASKNTEDELTTNATIKEKIIPKKFQEVKDIPIANPTLNSQELSKKLSLLISEDDIDRARFLVENRLKNSKNQSYIYIGGAVGLVILMLSNGSLLEMFSSGKDTIDGTLAFIEKFYPGISAALPTVISGNTFKKLNGHKHDISLIDQIKSKRNRMHKAIDSFSENEINELEDDLKKLI